MGILKKKRRAKPKPEPESGDWKLTARVYFVGVVLIVWFAGMGGRLFQLMFYPDERVSQFAERQSVGSVNIHLPRGLIYDRNMNEMAVSIELRSIYVNPRLVGDLDRLAIAMGKIIEPRSIAKRAKFTKRLARSLKKRKEKSFVWVKRKVTPDIYAKMKSRKLPGVAYVKEFKRFYPKRDIAAKIIGFCGIDNQGLYGLEYYYDDVIKPITSRMRVLKDARGKAITMPGSMAEEGGAMPFDLTLTIDERIQYVAEKALERQVKKSSAKAGVAVVMDPKTGEVLAMAEMPKYNPNNYSKYTSDWWKPKAVSNAVEPGSTFKLFVAATAIEKGLVTSDDYINCENGSYRIGRHTIREASNHRFNQLTVAQVIAKSSNIGAIKLAEKIGPEDLYSFMRSFGFGVKTGIDLPGETAGLLRPVHKWSSLSLASISFGQEISVTPIQLATGVSVFANGGFLVHPHLVKSYIRDGVKTDSLKLRTDHRVISASTAATMKRIMAEAVVKGTGKDAAAPGFVVAGKTGTAQKIDTKTKTYSKDKNIASFVGFFPVDNPRLTIVVMVDEPKDIVWGGSVAAPVFSEIAARAARIMRIPSSFTEVYEIDWEKMRNKKEKEVTDAKAKGSVAGVIRSIAKNVENKT